MNVLHTFFYDWSVNVGMTLAGCAFFGGLTIYSFVRRDKRVYIPGLLLIDFGFLNTLVRDLFFFHLSPHPAKPGGVWRLASALVIVWGFVLCERTLRRERAKEHDGIVGRSPN